jgi:hypothetical protein
MVSVEGLMDLNKAYELLVEDALVCEITRLLSAE